MKFLKNPDIVISLILGCLVSISLAQFQIHKKKIYSRLSPKSKTVVLNLVENKHNSKTFTLLPKTNLTSKIKRSLSNDDSSITQNRSIIASGDQFENTPEFTDESTPSDNRFEVSDQTVRMNSKIESYLVNHIGLSSDEANRVISSKLRMENEIYRNNQSINHKTEQENIQLNTMNQEVLSSYNDELKHILGLENYQIFTVWQNEQEAALAESNAGGRPFLADNQNL